MVLPAAATGVRLVDINNQISFSGVDPFAVKLILFKP
jgi:hypothetical protein